MEFKSDIQIAQESVMTNISKIAADEMCIRDSVVM